MTTKAYGERIFMDVKPQLEADSFDQHNRAFGCMLADYRKAVRVMN
ncbi:MAG TPA: hypothetical protein VIJ27_11195 [Mucilaginibacter sp.]